MTEVFRTVPVRGVGWRRLFSFLGPGYLVAVGYMDPGNWATDLYGGSAFGYTLLSVILLSNVMAMVLQHLAVRLGIATGRDLAQACRDQYSKPTVALLWLFCEIAICACDMAELIGTAIALQLLFGIPLVWGVALTGFDVLILLLLQRSGIRFLEAFVAVLLLSIALCFAVEMALVRPDWGGVAGGFVPSSKVWTDPIMLYVAIGIIGATVMPHNLYLHSAIVQSRCYDRSPNGKREALRFATIDSTLALFGALFINASILILAAAAFHATGQTVIEIAQAHKLLSPTLGVAAASTVFAVALLASGQNSAITATLAGQIVMEGFMNWRLPPSLRRLLTRGIAIVPALFVTYAYGQTATAKLLILSQVILSLQLPFAVFPLIAFTSSRAKMGEMVSPRWLCLSAWMIGLLIALLNLKLVWDVFSNG
ncbi:Nramp family divalent metal transporter [Sphingobium sp.]|uniref:Nramp family divalent metal transporter n=1 Tax=Sphingobium sp. TaxID=1912891 RepID=UPI0028BE1B0C|nr:Nramp family divalent metal transporter [Sphingobium sp.]